MAKGVKFCTVCGAKMKKPFHKTVWFWVIVVIIGLGVIGNIGNNSPSEQVSGEVKEEEKQKSQNENEAASSKSTTKEVEEKAEQKTEFVLGEVANLKGMDLQVVGIQVSNGSELNTPKDGHEFVIVDVIMKNSSDKNLSYNVFDFKMQNSNGQITDSGFILAGNENPLNSGELIAGGVVRGTIAFEQPKGDKGLKLIYKNSIFSSKEIKIDLSKKIDGFKPLEGEQVSISQDIAKIGEGLELDGVKVVVTKIEKSAGDDWNKPKDGNEYVIVHLSISNISNEIKDYNPFNFKLQNGKGNRTDQAFATINQDTVLNSGELAAGGKVEGTIIFEAPKDDQNLVLIYESNMFTGNQGQISLK